MNYDNKKLCSRQNGGIDIVKITGNVAKWEIANAIQNYNGTEICSYYNTMLPFRHCYHVNDNECDIKEFCKIVEKV